MQIYSSISLPLKISKLLLLLLLPASMAFGQVTGDAELLGMLDQPLGATIVVRFAMEYGGYPHKKFFLRDFEESPQDPTRMRLKDKMVLDGEKVERGFSIPIDFSTHNGRINYIGIRGPQILEQNALKANRKAWAGLLKRNYFGGVRFGMSRTEAVGMLGPTIKDKEMLVVKDLSDSVTVHFLFRSGKVDGINLFFLSKADRMEVAEKSLSYPESNAGNAAESKSPPTLIFSKEKDLHGVLDLIPNLPENIGAPGLKLAFIRNAKDPKENGIYIESYCYQCPGTKTLSMAETNRITQIDGTEITPEMGPDKIRALLQGRVGTQVKVGLRSQVFPLLRNNYPIPKVTWVEM